MLIELEPTEKRLACLFGQAIVDRIKQSDTLICRVQHLDHCYRVGYDPNRKKFYTASYLPFWLKYVI